jgi:hypothetical protein
MSFLDTSLTGCLQLIIYSTFLYTIRDLIKSCTIYQGILLDDPAQRSCAVLFKTNIIFYLVDI